MRLLSEVRTRWRALRHGHAMDRELRAEIRFHLRMETDRNLRAGMTPRQARRVALQRFGTVSHYRAETREARGVMPLEDFVQDVKHGFRILIKSPAFSAVAVLTLALGIGAVTVIFSVVNSVLLEPLPFQRPEELVLLWTANEGAGQERYFVSPMEYDDWRTQLASFSHVAAFWRTQVTLTELDGGPVRLQSAMSSDNLLTTVGATPIVGRVFTPDDGVPGAQPVVVLSHGFWQRRFGGDRSIVGQSLIVEGGSSEVVGVLGPDQSFPEDSEIWTNINFPYQIQSRGARWLNSVARLAPGKTIEDAQSEVDALSASLAEEYPNFNEGWTVTMAGMHDTLVGDVRPALLVLLAATVLILVISCANVANLLLARSEARAREIAVRTAFGASRSRLARQLLTESLVMATVGAMAGLALTVIGLRVLQVMAPDNLPRIADVTVNSTVLLVTLASTVITGFMFGLAPVVRLVRANLGDHLKEGTKGSRGPEGHRLQNSFVVAQLALAAVLVIGSGLLVRSFANLRAVDPGFRTSGVLTFELNVPNATYQNDSDVSGFYDRFLPALRGLGGVEEVTMGSSLPLRESRDYNSPFSIVDHAPREDVEYRTYYRQVDPRYFSAMGVPLLSGRFLTDLDVVDAPGVVVVNRSFARTFFGEGRAVDERLTNVQSRYGPLGAMLVNDVEIVGVVEDIKYAGLKLDSEPSIYFTYRQAPFRRMTVAVRTTRDPGDLLPVVRETLDSLDPSMPISNVETIENVVDRALARDRFSTLLLTLFGAVALTLATVGIYGVLSFAVEQRVREVGIRMALGAQTGDVLRLILRDGAVLVAVGLGVGLAGAVGLTRLLASQLYGVSATDVGVYAGVALFLAVVAIAASYVPARRATRTDPLDALRAE